MTNKRAIREGLIDDLGLGFINIRGLVVSNIEIDVVGIRDMIGDTDNRLLEGSFLLIKSKLIDAYASAATLNATITASQTNIRINQATPAVRVGDIIEVNSSEHMAIIDVTESAAAYTIVTVQRAVLGSTAATASNGNTVTLVEYGQWRSISAHSFSDDDVTLSRATLLSANDVLLVDFYFILTPEEINRSIDLALSKIWYTDDVSITLVTTENEYNLTTIATELTDVGQIISLNYRYISTDALTTRDTPVVNRKFVSNDDTVSVILYDRPSDNTNTTLRLAYRRWYAPQADDDTTITAPLALIRSAAKVEVLIKIFNKLGKAAKDNYGMELALAEREFEVIRARYKQSIVAVHIIQDEQIEPIVVPVEWGNEGNWW